MMTKKNYDAPLCEYAEMGTQQPLAASNLTLPDPRWSDPVNW